MKSKTRRRPARVLRVVLTVAATFVLAAVLFHEVGTSAQLVSALRSAKPWWLVFSFALSCACVFLGVVRWQLVLAAMGRSLAFGPALEAVLAAWPLAVVTPSRVNDLLRAVVVRDAVPIATGTGSLLAEKAIDLFLLLSLAGVGAAFGGLWSWLAAVVALLLAEVAFVVLVVARRRWLAGLPILRARAAHVAELLIAFDALHRAPGRLAASGAVSLAIRLLTVGITHSLLVAFGADVRLSETLILWPLAMLVGVAPVTLAGMGTRDAAFIYLLVARGATVAPSAVLLATMGYSVVAIWSFALIGLPLFFRALLRGRRSPGPS